MMVETMLESSQDFGMSNGALPQWKREVLQRRAARSRTAAAPPAPPPPAPADDDEELRYGPGIVKRLQSRYLSLALRDAPRRRPSVLRRAASLEHLLDERPPPGPCARPTTHPRPPRPQSMAAPPAPLAPAQRRESVKRARSVDALSRLDTREDSRAISSSPPLPPPQPPRPPPFPARSARTPRRPTPLLRETERPPPDVVRSTLRKFESAPTRRPAPAARVSAVLRGLECPRTSTPEPREPADGPPLSPRTPSPPSLVPTSEFDAAPSPVLGPAHVSASASASISGAALVPAHVLPPATPSVAPPANPLVPLPSTPAGSPPPAPLVPPPPIPSVPPPATPPTVQDESAQNGTVAGARPASGGARPVSRAALDGIARAGSTVRYVFEAPCAASHLPPLAATNPVLLGRARRIGVIRPMPARTAGSVAESSVEENDEKTPDRLASPVPPSSPPPIENDPPPPNRIERKEPPPAALVEPIPRTPPDAPRPATPPHSSPPPLIIERSPSPKTKLKSNAITAPLVNGHAGLERTPENKGAFSRIGAAGIERAWSGSGEKKPADATEKSVAPAPWARPGAAARARAPPPACTSVVFNFSNRKEVPDYIENDGIILRGSRKNRIKPGEPGVVVLRPEALARCDSDSETETDGGPPSPCAVKFINDNVLINGKSSMPGKPNKDRISKLKLQFDDSLTRTFEYPSEVSLCDDAPASPPPAPAPAPQQQLAESPMHAPLAANTHIASASLSRYTPHKTAADAFQLGVTRHDAPDTRKTATAEAEAGAGAEAGAEGDARPCGADVARSWSEARTLTTDLLF